MTEDRLGSRLAAHDEGEARGEQEDPDYMGKTHPDHRPGNGLRPPGKSDDADHESKSGRQESYPNEPLESEHGRGATLVRAPKNLKNDPRCEARGPDPRERERHGGQTPHPRGRARLNRHEAHRTPGGGVATRMSGDKTAVGRICTRLSSGEALFWARSRVPSVPLAFLSDRKSPLAFLPEHA
jgi:hypothetical protein